MNIVMKKEDALELFRGNAAELARAIGITRQAVKNWSEYVPENSAFKLLHANPKIPHKFIGTKKP